MPGNPEQRRPVAVPRDRPVAGGFSLLELIIVVAIVGILASVAYPSYQNYLRTARYSDAVVALTSAADTLERYYSVNGRYTGETLGNLYGTDSPEKYYDLSLTSNTTTYTLKASPDPNEAMKGDTQCGVFTFNQAGVKCILNGTKCNTASDAATREAVAACW